MLRFQVSALERQLVMELLALFTPEAVAGQAQLPKARRAAGPAAEQVLMDALGRPSSAGAHEPGQSLVRLAALTQLTGLYPSLAPAHQQQLVQVALHLTLLNVSVLHVCMLSDALIAAHLYTHMHEALSTCWDPVVQVYDQTECCACCTTDLS